DRVRAARRLRLAVVRVPAAGGAAPVARAAAEGAERIRCADAGSNRGNRPDHRNSGCGPGPAAAAPAGAGAVAAALLPRGGGGRAEGEEGGAQAAGEGDDVGGQGDG